LRWDSDHDSFVDGDRDSERLLVLSGCPSAKTKVNAMQMTGHYQILPNVKPVPRVTLCLLVH